MRAIEILKDNLEKLHEISDFLLKEETITGEQFMEILNKKPVENNEISKEESSNHNLAEEKNLDNEKLLEEKESSSGNQNEELIKDLEETLRENDKKEENSSNENLEDTIALGSKDQTDEEDNK